MASVDLVTGLDARATWQPVVEGLAARGTPFSAVICDVIGLKPVNETAGFKAGDARLRRAAQRLRATCAGALLVGRLGGDELVAIFVGEDALAAASRGAAALAAPGDPPVRSAALAALPGEAPDELIDRLYATMRAS